MLDVYGTSCPPSRQRWISVAQTGRRTGGWIGGPSLRRMAAFASSALTGTVLAAFMLHLLATLAGRLDSVDAAGILAVLIGMAVVLVTLLPFTLLCARRAGEAWRGGA